LKNIPIFLAAFLFAGCAEGFAAYPIDDAANLVYVAQTVPPAGETAAAPVILGEFTTKFNPALKNRAHNIKLAAAKLDNLVLPPFETFSCNAALGETGRAQGYRMARIFIKGEESRGYGGGVCQVATTLYNAALSAGFDIIERHAHSKDVSYVGAGRDAAVSFGGVDLKMVNIGEVPAIIKTYVTGDSITIRLQSL
jgi:vancomycin resistance protein YoaR